MKSLTRHADICVDHTQFPEYLEIIHILFIILSSGCSTLGTDEEYAENGERR